MNKLGQQPWWTLFEHKSAWSPISNHGALTGINDERDVRFETFHYLSLSLTFCQHSNANS